MPDSQRGTDRLGRRAKRLLSPSQKYEIWLQLVRQETTVSEAADRLEVDRSTIMRIREVARQGALEALASSKPGVQPTRRTPSWRRLVPRSPGWARRSRSWRSS
jgi:transposase